MGGRAVKRQVVIALRLAVALVASLQAPTVIRDDCGSCALSLTRRTAVLDTSGAIVGPPRVVRTTPARELIVLSSVGDPPVIYDSLGRLLRTVGGKGVGPGETSRASAVLVTSAGVVRVYSPGRINEFRSDGTFVRAEAYRNALAANNTFLATGETASSGMGVGGTNSWRRGDGLADPVVIRAPDGLVVRSIELPTEHRFARRVLGPARDGAQFWVADYFDDPASAGAILSLISATGKVLRTLRFRPSWWSREVGRRINGVSEAGSSIVAVRELAAGQLLLLVQRPRAELSDAQIEGFVKSGNGRSAFEVAIVTVDLSATRITGIAAVPGAPSAIISDSRFVTYRETLAGLPMLEVWEFATNAKR